VERQAVGVGMQIPGSASAGDVALLSSADDRELIKCILRAQDEIDDAASARQPHRVLYLAGELAKATNVVYQKEKVISDDAALAGARLCLVRSARLLLGAYAALLGVSLPESM
jgi:arginyl-tRNA synthetase